MNILQKVIVLLIVLFGLSLFVIENANAIEGAKQFNFQFENTEVTDVIKVFTRETNQKFVVDSSVKAKINIFASNPVGEEEAFHMLSKSLATKGFGLVRHGDLWIVRQVRQLQKDMLPVVTSLPDPIPERMLNLVITLNYINSDLFNKKMKILLSKDGTVNAVAENKIIITDWISNLYQIQSLLVEVDKADTKVNLKAK